MTWEAIVKTAIQMGDGEGERAKALCDAIVAFDESVKQGAKLPVSWRPFSVHLAGYDKLPAKAYPEDFDCPVCHCGAGGTCLRVSVHLSGQKRATAHDVRLALAAEANGEVL